MLDLIPMGKKNAIKRKALRQLCYMDDGAMRATISKIRKVNKASHTILNDQDGDGYYRPIFPDDYEKVLRFIRQEESRARSIRESLRSARAFIKAVENQNQIGGFFDDTK